CLVDALHAPPISLEVAWAEVTAGRCAQEIEAAAWAISSSLETAARSYRQKVRFLATTLKRPDNMQLLHNLLSGEVACSELVQWPEEEFLGEAQKRQRQKDRADALADIVLKEHALDFFDSRLSCPRCRASGARYAVLRLLQFEGLLGTASCWRQHGAHAEGHRQVHPRRMPCLQ
ncbi:unnamed protein product, partial [Symbiodinium pilosum]